MNIDLDLNLPFCAAPPHLPPAMDTHAYLEFIEFNLRCAAANNTLEGIRAARPGPNPEWFTIAHSEVERNCLSPNGPKSPDGPRH